MTIAANLVELGRDVSLAGGSAGVALLYAYLDGIRRGRDYSMLAGAYLARALRQEDAPAVCPSLYRGATGVAWAAAHLQKEAALTGAVDRALASLLEHSPPKGDYSLADGLVGYGVYALERFGQPKAPVILERVVDRLDELAVRSEGGVTWLTGPGRLPPHLRARAPAGCYDLGLARGLPGAVALLAAAVRLDVNAGKARPLLDGAVRWLLAQQLEGSRTVCFPAWAAPSEVRRPARSGWCHGDPGVAAALLVAARAVQEPQWEREAVAIARRAAGRPPAETGVTDAAFCHGAAGLAHLFNRLHQATGDRELGLSARFWIEQTLALPRPAGNGLLRGAAGVGLVLLAAATDLEPAWDRCFLLSLRGH